MNAPERARDHLRPQRDRGAQPRRLRVGRPASARATSCSSPSSSTTRTSSRGSTSRTGTAPSSGSSRSTTTATSGLDEVARDENVKVVATNVVSNSLGTIADIPRLARWTHERGAILTCDAAQAAPHVRLDVQALGCDFVAVSGHKMCGPSGIGFLWGRGELLLEMEPFLLGGHMIRNVGDEKTTWGELPSSSRPEPRPSPRPSGSAPRSTTSRRSASRRSRRTSTSSPPTRSTPRRGPGHHALRPAGRPPRRDRHVQRRRRPPARHGADPRPRRESRSAPATTAASR